MKKDNQPTVYRGEIYYADLSPVLGSEQGGSRPVLILQNNIGNKHSPTIIAAPITCRLSKKHIPAHVQISEGGLHEDSLVLLEQIRVLDKLRLKMRIGAVSAETMNKVDAALKIELGLV